MKCMVVALTSVGMICILEQMICVLRAGCISVAYACDMSLWSTDHVEVTLS
jgi:hypothetical protein